MATQRPKPIFAVLADGHKIGNRGKVDCYGIFSSVGVWALPATRECSIAFGIKNVPKGKTPFTFWIRKSGQRARHMADGEMHTSEAIPVSTYADRIKLQLREVGNLEVGLAVGKRLSGHNAFWIPLSVHTLPWPELPVGSDLQNILDNPQSIKSVRAKLKCDKCESEYIFQVNLDATAKLSNEVRSLPKNGVFNCTKCNKRHELKDVEGQILTQLGKIMKDES